MTRLTTTRQLTIFLAINVLIVNTICWVGMKNYNPRLWGTGEGLGIVLTLNGGSDSWKVQRAALDHLRKHPTEPLYSEMLIKKNVKFHYPLTTMLIFQPIDALCAKTQIDCDKAMTAIGWLFTALFICSTAILFEQLLRATRDNVDFSNGAALRFVLVGAATLTFFPFIWGFAKGNWQIWINAFFAAALLAWV